MIEDASLVIMSVSAMVVSDIIWSPVLDPLSVVIHSLVFMLVISSSPVLLQDSVVIPSLVLIVAVVSSHVFVLL